MIFRGWEPSTIASTIRGRSDLAFIVPLAGATEPIEQVMALQPREHPAAFASSVAKDPGNSKPGVVVGCAWHASEKRKGADMAIAKRLRRLSRIGLYEAAIGMRQVHAEIMPPYPLARDDGVGLAKIHLRMPD